MVPSTVPAASPSSSSHIRLSRTNTFLSHPYRYFGWPRRLAELRSSQIRPDTRRRFQEFRGGGRCFLDCVCKKKTGRALFCHGDLSVTDRPGPVSCLRLSLLLEFTGAGAVSKTLRNFTGAGQRAEKLRDAVLAMPAENRTEASELSEEVRTAARSLLSSAASGDVDAFREAASKLPEGQAPGFREPAHQRNALHIAALSGHANVVAAAVDEFRFPQDEPDQQGDCPQPGDPLLASPIRLSAGSGSRSHVVRFAPRSPPGEGSHNT